MSAMNRRETEWFTLQRGYTALAAGGQTNETLINATSIGARFIKGTTITRMLLDFRMKPDSVAQQCNAFAGIVVMNADARAAGAFPEADDVSDRAGWLWRARFAPMASSLSDGSQFEVRHLDIRSQRKLRTEEDELQLVIDNGDSFIVNWSVYIRVLVKWA